MAALLFRRKFPACFDERHRASQGFPGAPERKRSVFRRRKQKSATKPLSFRGSAVLQKAAHSRITFAATASRLKEDRIPPITNIPGEISLSPDAAAKAQRISFSPPRRKKTFRQTTKYRGKGMERQNFHAAPTPSLLFLYPPFAGKSSFSRFLNPKRKGNAHARVLRSFSLYFNTLWKIFQPFSSEKARRN